MKLYYEIRLQAYMLVSTGIGLICSLALLAAGLIQNNIPYLLGSGGLLLFVFVIVSIGQRRSQVIVDRMAKIRDGGGDAADLAWLKSRNK